MTGVRDLITYATSGDDRLEGLGAAGEGHNLLFPIDFDSRPYNTRIAVQVCNQIK